MKYAAIIAAILLSGPLTAGVLPTMPEGFRKIFSDETGKTWRETGEFALAPDEALALVSTSMTNQGYVVRHDIGGKKGWSAGRVLLFSKGESDDEIIVSLWRKADNLTGCSWGVSSRGPAKTASPGSNLSEPNPQPNPKGVSDHGTPGNVDNPPRNDATEQGE